MFPKIVAERVATPALSATTLPFCTRAISSFVLLQSTVSGVTSSPFFVTFSPSGISAVPVISESTMEVLNPPSKG